MIYLHRPIRVDTYESTELADSSYSSYARKELKTDRISIDEYL
jgi:hypothetical protein